MDRPRRALVEEPDDVESYVARRSRGFTPADNGDHLAARPARAARALEPPVITHSSPESDQLGFSDPVPRPRRAVLPEPSLPEPLLPDADKESHGRDRGGDAAGAPWILCPADTPSLLYGWSRLAPAAPTPAVTSPPAATQRALTEF